MSSKTFTRLVRPMPATATRGPDQPAKDPGQRPPHHTGERQPVTAPSPGTGAHLGMYSILPPAPIPVQTKLTVSEPGDRFETEADDIAEHVMAQTDPAVQPGEANEDENENAEAPSSTVPAPTPLQTPTLAETITPLVQRQANAIEDAVLEEEEEDTDDETQTVPFQTKGLSTGPALQRQTDTETEEEEDTDANTLQTKGVLQRQTDTETEEEEDTDANTLQTKGVFQRQTDTETEEEEDTDANTLQTKGVLQRQTDTEIDEDENTDTDTLQAKAAAAPARFTGLDTILDSLRGAGQPLPDATRDFFEPRFGQDFSQVRIHADPPAATAARRLHAQAFTRGSDVFFAPGHYQPHTHQGRQLLAHELTHTIQQTGKRPLPRPLSPTRELTAANGHAGGWPGMAQQIRQEREALATPPPSGHAGGWPGMAHHVRQERQALATPPSGRPGGWPGLSHQIRQERQALATPAVLRQVAPDIDERAAAEIGPPEITESPEALIEWIVGKLQTDPEDRAGEVSLRLSDLRPEARMAVMARVRKQLPPQAFAGMGNSTEKTTPSALETVPPATRQEAFAPAATEALPPPDSAATPEVKAGPAAPTPDVASPPAPLAAVFKAKPRTAIAPEMEPLVTPIELAIPTETPAVPAPTEAEAAPQAAPTAAPEPTLPTEETAPTTTAPAAEVPTGAAAATPVEGAPADTAAVSITVEDPGGILDQLAKVAPSAAFSAYTQAEGVSAKALEQQKDELQTSLPEIPAPTGLPPIGTEAEKPAAQATKTPPARLQGEKSGREGEPYSTRATEAPPPPPQPATVLRGSAQAAEPEANTELARSARGALEGVRLDARQITTGAGPRPSVDLSGEADPTQVAAFRGETDKEAMEAKAEAEKDIHQEHGENSIFPEPTNEILKPTKTLTAPTPPTAPTGEAPTLPPEAVQGLDASLAPELNTRIGEKRDEYTAGKGKFDSDVSEARDKADTDIAELTTQAQQEQLQEQDKTKQEVAGFQEEWQQELDGVAEEYQSKAQQATTDTGSDIVEEKHKAEVKTQEHLADAEDKAAAEKRKAEDKAQEEKRKTKEESGGFWGWTKRLAGALIDGLKKAVNFIYDGLRTVVKGIFEAAKLLVQGVIELGRMAIVGLIKLYGELLKGFVKLALAAFPDIAKQITDKIDAAVEAAVETVNSIAEGLKTAVGAVLDFLANALDKLLGLIQSLYNGLFTFIGMLIRGEFKAIMQGIGNLVDAAKQMPEHFWGETTQELLGMDLNEPLPIERTAPPKPTETAATAEETGLIPPQDLALLNRPVLGDREVVVDNVAEEEANPVLVASLNLKEGQEVKFGESTDPARSIEAIKAEMLGEPATAATAPVSGGTAVTEPTLTPEQEPQNLINQEPESGCTKEKSAEPAKETEVPESMKIGPLTPGQRARYLMHQMRKGISQWFECNWPWLLAGAVAGLVGFIALNIVTGGALLASLPLLMQLVGAIMIGVGLARITVLVGDYLSQGWAGNTVKAAKSLARALAIGAVELIFALLFNLRAVVKSLKAGLKASVKAAGRAAKATVITTTRNVRQLGRLGLQAGRATIRNGKLILTGLKSGFSKGVRSLDDLAKRLWQRVRFKRFILKRAGQWIELWGVINPRVLIARIKVVFPGVDNTTAREIAKVVKSDRRFIVKAAAVFEKLATKPSDAKKAVQGIVNRLARERKGVFGIPDNIKTTASGLIKEVEEVKFYGKDTLERLGNLARTNPKKFVSEGLGKFRHIQINRHVETINAIASDTRLIAGTGIKGVSKNVKYVVTLPKFAGKDLKAVEAAIPFMEQAWKNILGVNVKVVFGSHTTKEVIEGVKELL